MFYGAFRGVTITTGRQQEVTREWVGGWMVDGGCFPNYRMMVSKAEQEVKGGQDGSATALSNVLQLQTLKRT